VAQPLVRAFVNDDEVESQADAHAGPIAFEIAVREMIAVGDGTLVLHAGVRHFDEFVAVFLEGILAEIVLERLEHALGLRELFFRFVQIFGKRIEIERKIAEFV
jgi:hypothetical protein